MITEVGSVGALGQCGRVSRFLGLTRFGFGQVLPNGHVTGSKLFLDAHGRRTGTAFAVVGAVRRKTVGIPAFFDELSAGEVFKHRLGQIP